MRSVTPFGDSSARLPIVGPAAGIHGANTGGKPFTGDYAGLPLYETLYPFAYSDQIKAEALDYKCLLGA